MELKKNRIYYFEDKNETEVLLAILGNNEYNWLLYDEDQRKFNLKKGMKEDFEKNSYTYFFEVSPNNIYENFLKTRAIGVINREKLEGYEEFLKFLNNYEYIYKYSVLEEYLLEKFEITKPKSIEDLFKIQKFYNEQLIEIKKKEFSFYRELDSWDIRNCILDKIQEFKKELPYEYNFKTYRYKPFSEEKLKEEFVDILNFILCRVLKNESVKLFEEAWNNYLEKIIYEKLDSINKNEMDLAVRHFEYWGTSAEFETTNRQKVESFTVSSYLELGAIFGFSREVIYEQYWQKFLYNCKRDLKMER